VLGCVDLEGDPATGEAAPVLLEQDAGATRDGEEVDVTVEPARAGDERHPIVPVRSWVMPPLSRRRSTATNPAARTSSSMAAGAGR
jgi:hypothetical protein